MAEYPISINLAENIIRVAQAGNSSGKIDIAVITHQSDSPAFFESDTDKVLNEETQSLKKILDNLKFRKRPVNIVIPDGFTYSQILYMPRLKEKELLSAIRYQADQFIPMPIEDTSIDLEILYEDKINNKLLVLIIAAPQKLVDRIQKLIEQTGVFPELIENELSATGKFLTNFYFPTITTGGTIFINLGYTYTSFYLFDHKLRLIIDSHTFPAGYSVFLREAQVDINIDITKARNLIKKIGFSPDTSIDLNQILQPATEALCAELKKFVNSVQNKHKISPGSLMLFNLANEINYLDKKIESCISIPVRFFDPHPFTKKTSSVISNIHDLPSFVAAIGGCLS